MYFLQVSTWSSVELYDKLSAICFVASPTERGTFSAIVKVLEVFLSKKEKNEYNELAEHYSSMRANMVDPETQMKRSLNISGDSLRHSNATSSDVNMINLSPSKRRLSHSLNEFKFNAKSHGNPNLSRNGKVSCDVTVHNASSLHKNTNITYTSEPLQSIFHTDEQEIQQNDDGAISYVTLDEATGFQK